MKKPDLKPNANAWLTPIMNTFSESRGIKVLSALLALQLIVAVGLLLRSNTNTDFSSAGQLIAFDPAAVTQITIAEEDNSVILTRTNDRWRMNDEYESPAAMRMIDELLGSLNDLKPGLPVANTAGAHAQLEVSESAYQRQLTLKTVDDTVADLYLGTSPGFRKSHARQIDQDEVYAVRLNTFDVPADLDHWLDKDLLGFNDITSIEADSIKLTKNDDNWFIEIPADQSDSHEVGSTAIESVLSQLSTLRVTGFTEALLADDPAEETASDSENATTGADSNSGSDAGKSEEAAEPLLINELKITQGEKPVTLTLSKKGSDATVMRSDVQGVFALPLSSFDALTPEALQGVIVEKSVEEPAEEAAGEAVDTADSPNG